MDRWQGKLAVVTGASAGIGSAVCVALADAGMTVVGLARRAQLVDMLQSSVKGKGSIVSRQCDVSSAEELASTFQWIENQFGCIHVAVNNAGVLYDGQITDVGNKPLNENALLATIDVNLKAPILCTKHVVSSMKRHSFDGHIVIINSIAGHYIPLIDNMNVYATSKHGLTAFIASLANELAKFKCYIKTTNISPGLVATDMGSQLIESEVPLMTAALQPKDIADAVIYALSTPPSVNIEQLTISPIFVSRL